MKAELDLNLLKVLPLLHQYKRLKEVAKVLGKSEASVSKYLSRLREQFGNDLFTQDAQNGYVATPFMLSIMGEIETSLNTLEQLLNKKTFDPKIVSKEITIAMSPFIQFFMGQKLLTRLAKTLPNSTFRFTTWDGDSQQNLLNDQIDIGVQLFNEQLPKSIYQKHLTHFDYTLIVPSHLSHLTFDEICQLPFVLPTIKGWQFEQGAQAQLMKEQGLKIKVIAQFDSIAGVLNSVKEIDGATIIATPPTQLEGFHYRELQLPHASNPPVVSLVKLNNRNNALYQLLMNELKQALTVKPA